MRTKYLDIAKSEITSISFMSNTDAFNLFRKGWGYSYVYSLKEIRDVFLALKENKFINIKQFAESYIIGKINYAKQEWNIRRVLEVINALKNFDLIDNNCSVIKSENSFTSQIGEELTANDIEIFKHIYITYFRFKELLILYLCPEIFAKNEININEISIHRIIKESKPIFSFCSAGRYVDSFFLTLTNAPRIYRIPEFNEAMDKNGGVTRFWDVFVSWGIQLGYLEKFNMNSLFYKLSNEKSFVCSYILSGDSINVRLSDYIKINFKNKLYIDISELVYKICVDFRVSVECAQKFIIEEYKSNQDLISLARTSEVFIKRGDILKTDKILYPIYMGSYVSHLILRV
ncbi:MAG: hypothetical protein ACOYOT_01815 [Bacteroidales bacterium]